MFSLGWLFLKSAEVFAVLCGDGEVPFYCKIISFLCEKGTLLIELIL